MALNGPAAAAPTPLPKKQLLVLAVININDAFAMNVIWPFLPFFVVFTGMAADEGSAGTYVGIMASSYSLAGFLSSFAWGVASDRFGRRPVLLLGLCGSVGAMLMLAFARSYAAGVAARVLSGLLNGNLGVTKTYLGEITDESNRPAGFSVLGLVWGVASIVAPVVGGFLADPHTAYPGSPLDTALLRRFPYALPCFVSCAVGLFSILGGLFLLPESPRWLARRAAKLTRRRAAAADAAASTAKSGGTAAGSGATYVQLVAPRKDVVRSASTQSYHRLEDARERVAGAGGEGEEEVDELEEVDVRDEAASARLQGREAGRSGEEQVGDSSEESTAEGAPPGDNSAVSELAESLRLVRDARVLVPCSCYGLIALQYTIFDEVLPVFAREERALGGLGFSSSGIGIMLAIQGVVTLVYQLLFYPPMAARFGLKAMFRGATLWAVPAFLATPATPMLAAIGAAPMWAALALLMTAKAVLDVIVFTSVMVTIANSAPSHQLGAANGLGQSLAAFARAVGPVSGGLLWAASTQWHFPMHSWAVFVAMAAVGGVLLVVSRRLPNDAPRRSGGEASSNLMASEEEEEDAAAAAAAARDDSLAKVWD
jgi:MFS family permease